MHCLRKLASLLLLGKLAEAIPYPGIWQKTDPTITTTSTKTSTSTETVTPTPTPTTTRRMPDCSKGGECDCSVIEDKSSPEYFQCVTNAFCEVCWVTTLTQSPTTTTTDHRTMPPGTYTVTMSNGAIQIIIVTTTPPVDVTTTVTTTTTLTDEATLTNQAVAAVAPPAYENGDAGSGDAGTLTVTAASAEGTCPPACDCSWVKLRKADDYCVVNLACESCGDEIGG